MELDLKCIIIFVVLLILTNEYFKISKLENMENSPPEDNVEEDNVEEDNVEEDNVEEDNVEEDNVEEDNVEEDNVEEDNVEEDNVEEDNVEASTSNDVVRLRDPQLNRNMAPTEASSSMTIPGIFANDEGVFY